MKVFVTGVAGFLGSWIAESLLKAGHSVVGVDNFVGGEENNIPLACKVYRPSADIRDLVLMTKMCEGCDAVYHCAALAYEGLSVFSPSMVADNVVGGSVAVATAAVRCGMKRFVNCSSMARYGLPYCEDGKSAPFHECDEPEPIDPYGHSKLAAERILNVVGEQHGMKVLHAVPHNIYGPRQKYDDPYRNVAAIFANLMLQGKQPRVYGDGQQVRCFSYVADVVPVMLRLLDCDAEHGELFNVGPDEGEVTVKELWARLADITGFKLPMLHLPARPREVKHAVCSAQKIRERFGWSMWTSLDDGLRSLVAYIERRGVRQFKYHLPIEIDGPDVPRTWKERLY